MTKLEREVTSLRLAPSGLELTKLKDQLGFSGLELTKLKDQLGWYRIQLDYWQNNSSGASVSSGYTAYSADAQQAVEIG